MCIFDVPYYYCAVQCNVVFASEIRQLQQLSKSPAAAAQQNPFPVWGASAWQNWLLGPKTHFHPLEQVNAAPP